MSTHTQSARKKSVSPMNRDKNAEPTLPTDMIQEVLLRLPLKELYKCKCVSRELRNLVSRQDFIRSYRFQSKIEAMPLVLFPANKQDDDGTESVHFVTKDLANGSLISKFRKVLPIDFHSPFACLCSCRELVLMHSHVGLVFLCNPAIRELVDLTEQCKNFLFSSITLGYIPSTMDYQIVGFDPFFPETYGGTEKKDVFCIKFRLLTISFNGVIGPEQSYIKYFKNEHGYNQRVEVTYPVCANGCMYAVIGDGRRRIPSIVSFNLETDEAGIVPDFGEHFDPQSLILKESCCGRHLYAGVCFPLENLMKIWMLEEEPNYAWKMKYQIDFSKIEDFTNAKIPMTFSDYHDEISVEIVAVNVEFACIIFKADHLYFYHYNLEDGTFEEMVEFSESELEMPLYKSCAYHEGFFPLKG